MVPVVVSVAGGGLVVGLLVCAIGLLLVRSATPRRARHLAVRRRIALVREAPGEHTERRSAA